MLALAAPLCVLKNVPKCKWAKSVLPSPQTAMLPFQKEMDTKEGIQINQESAEQSLLSPSLHEKN